MLHQNQVVFLTPQAKAGFKASGNDYTRANIQHAQRGIIQHEYPSGLLNVRFELATIGYLTLNVSPEELTFIDACNTCKGTGTVAAAWSSTKTCHTCEGYGYHKERVAA